MDQTKVQTKLVIGLSAKIITVAVAVAVGVLVVVAVNYSLSTSRHREAMEASMIEQASRFTATADETNNQMSKVVSSGAIALDELVPELEEHVASCGDDFSDATGELASMVAGNAKAGFEGKKVSISCPSVIMGASHRIRQSKDMPAVRIPTECECGRFIIEVSLKADMASDAGGKLAQSA